MTDNVFCLDEYRPHFACTDPVTGYQHVIPVDLVADIVFGRRAMSECDNHEEMIRSLLHHLLEAIHDA